MFLQLKCRATVEAARKANVPWSEDIAELVKQTLQLNHPRCTSTTKK